mgnify:CR=1 FL=1
MRMAFHRCECEMGQAQNYEIYCPTLVLAECAAAISRQTDDPSLAEELIGIIIDMPAINLIPLDLPLAIRASTMALKYRLRGADSVYVAVAAAYDAALITWDKEMLKRGSMVVETSTPDLVVDDPAASSPDLAFRPISSYDFKFYRLFSNINNEKS